MLESRGVCGTRTVLLRNLQAGDLPAVLGVNPSITCDWPRTALASNRSNQKLVTHYDSNPSLLAAKEGIGDESKRTRLDVLQRCASH